MRTQIVFYSFFIAVISFSCAEQHGLRQPTANEISITGTVTYLDFEGGFYGIISENGNKYNPLNLPEEYQVDNLQVVLIAIPVKNTNSIFMWGSIIKIIEIQRSE